VNDGILLLPICTMYHNNIPEKKISPGDFILFTKKVQLSHLSSHISYFFIFVSMGGHCVALFIINFLPFHDLN